MSDRRTVSHRMTPEGRAIREKLAKKLGLSKSAVIELALRRLAEQEGIRLEIKAEEVTTTTSAVDH